MTVRIVLGHIDEYDDRVAAFAHQLGLTGIQLHTPVNLPGAEGYWSVAELQELADRCKEARLVIEGLENVPAAHFWKIQRGLPGRDEQIENYIRTVRNMAKVGITLLGYNFLATYVWRTDMGSHGRGGAKVTSFDLADTHRGNALASYKLIPAEPVEEPITVEQMWDNHQYFLDAVLPIAEEEGVRLALHPDDPPVDVPLGGAARIFTSVAALIEAHRRTGDSPAWGLNFCVGTVSEMAGERSVNEVIDTLGRAGRIFYVHFRDVRGTVPQFTECFLGEGNINPARVIRRLHEAGFDGFLIDDHVPAMIGDLDTWRDTSPQAYCSRGRAHAIGYLQGIFNALGHALVDRELYLPRSWADDADRCREAGIPDGTGFATKPQLAHAMISRALQAGVPFSWFTADEAYGQAKWLHRWPEEREVSYVIAIRRSDTPTMPAPIAPASGPAGPAPPIWPGPQAAAGTSRMLPAGQGRGRAGPLPGPYLASVARPHHLVHARPGLASRKQGQSGKRGTGTSDPGMIGYTLAEIRRLLIKIAQPQPPGPGHTWSSSPWRRRRQYQARLCRYRRRGYALI